MNTSSILLFLSVYQNLLTELYNHEISHLRSKGDIMKLTKEVSLEYDFIKLSLYTFSQEEDDTTLTKDLYYRIEFKLKEKEGVHIDTYCSDPSRVAELEPIIQNHQKQYSYKWEESSTVLDNDFLTKYLDIADTIAKRACNCRKGDSYHPGYYSKISVSDESIVLSQINYMNSKSLDHKNDYSLRKLEFTIPLTNNKTEKLLGYNDYQIGEMIIEFSDRSSSNNKSCGDAIKEQIKIEKLNFLK